MAGEIKGEAVLLYVFDGTTDVLVGAQRGYEDEQSVSTINATTKLDAHERPLPGKRAGQVSLEALLLASDSGMGLLETAYANGSQVTLKRFVDGTEDASATGYVQRIRRSAPDGDMATVSVDIVLDSDFA